jgi:hypothetical protein
MKEEEEEDGMNGASKGEGRGLTVKLEAFVAAPVAVPGPPPAAGLYILPLLLAGAAAWRSIGSGWSVGMRPPPPGGLLEGSC